SQRRNCRRRSPDFASKDVARDFPRRADSQTRRRDPGRGIHPRNVFCLADYGPVSRGIGAQMASRLGAGFDRTGSALFQARAEGFWIVHEFWFAVAKNMERRNRAVFAILAAKLRFVGTAGAGACWIVRLACLEGQMALGRQAPGGYRVRARRGRDFRFRLFCPNGAVGLGQSEAHGMGLFSDSAFPVERHRWAVGVPRTRGYMSAAFWFGICHVARRAVCRTPGLWIDRTRQARSRRHGTSTFAGGSSLRHIPDLQPSSFA